ncbi:hypothetical protein PC116_g24723 [Phytophthora cactorum]|uniref:Uncharacterized protein n=1 Tax=Phytophthora cactorum TaxID=29920 RepID=A0A8T1JT15_9STRA|nr:hypothetical protein PC112_g20620 [Phytophthora cactorum]KAG2800327.1 hypothetical protein PC111_g20015 [Phytophthora cactorum]KAG2833600.1 hypothetical protein PC113_g20545 [Phytophthora cactorum]KAG2879060.1 hypothetical protein PC114_g22772 [Phytophthora cactorum]KAG2887507.1 hypothetical protein PC115_g20311 [Phytophthora cactorum]
MLPLSSLAHLQASRPAQRAAVALSLCILPRSRNSHRILVTTNLASSS